MTERLKPSAGAIRVGEFVVDPRSGELSGSGGRQTLSGQPLEALLALVDRPGEVVTRDELRARLWPADTYVDFEHGLNAIVKRLRDALGDSADSPRYIETVPRRGYRLIAPVEPASAGARQPPGAVSTAESAAAPTFVPALPGTSRSPRIVRPFVAVCALALLAAAFWVVLPWRSLPQAEEDSSTQTIPARPIRLTSGPGLQTDATFSPDGRSIAFSADRDGNFDLFTQSLDGGEPIRLTQSPANEAQPAWSPDGLQLVFRSDEDGGGLYVIGREGGAIRRIAAFGFQPAWMPGGREVVFAVGDPFLSALYLVSAEGGEVPRQILASEMAKGRLWGSFAVHPDGRIGLLGVGSDHKLGFFVSDREYRTVHSVGGEEQLRTDLPGRRTFWSARGDALYVEGLDAGMWDAWRVPVDPVTQHWKAPVRLTTSLGGVASAAISPDGKTFAFTSVLTSVRAWAFPFDADRGTPPGQGRPVTDEDASIQSLSLQGDGRAIFYLESRPGREARLLMRTDLDSGETIVLRNEVASSPVASPTGTGVAYMLSKPSAGIGMEYALAWRTLGGSERLLSTWSASGLVPTDVRRDDRAVLGSWIRPGRKRPVSLVEWPTGAGTVPEPGRVLIDIPTKQVWQGKYSPDGKWVSFVAGQDQGQGLELGLVSATVDRASAWTRVAADHPWPDKPRWSPDGRRLYFLSRAANGFYQLWGVRVDSTRGAASGKPFQLTHFDSPRWFIDQSYSSCEIGIAAGRLVLPMQTTRGSIWLLSNNGM